MKDSFWLGILVGTLAPILAYLLSTYMDLQTGYFVDKPNAMYVIAALVNLIVVRFTYRRGKISFARGVVFITFVAMLVLLISTRWK